MNFVMIRMKSGTWYSIHERYYEYLKQFKDGFPHKVDVFSSDYEEGAEVHIQLSEIEGFILSTPKTRRAVAENQIQHEKEIDSYLPAEWEE